MVDLFWMVTHMQVNAVLFTENRANKEKNYFTSTEQSTLFPKLKTLVSTFQFFTLKNLKDALFLSESWTFKVTEKLNVSLTLISETKKLQEN